MTDVMAAIEERAERIASHAEENEHLGRLHDDAAAALRETGIMRLLAPKAFGGHEAHPREFAEAVMKLASTDGSTGWVAGIVGVHPWELAMASPQAQEEVWGKGGVDADVWVASPYAPMGIIRPVDGGYIFNGHWQFSSGTDHCQWIFLGALLGDDEGQMAMPPTVKHVLLPRSDYEIVDDSWDVIGLKGTGSKDIIVRDAFIPEHRVVDNNDVMSGQAARDAGLDNPLYHVPFTTVFPLGITAAVIGICEGALAHHVAYQKTRVQITGAKLTSDPVSLYAISDAAAQIHAARTVLLDNVSVMYDRVVRGDEITYQQRAQSRRAQVSSCWTAVRAMDEIVARSGGNALRTSNPIQRFWRDGHMGLVHAVHVPNNVYQANALLDVDIDPTGPLRQMI